MSPRLGTGCLATLVLASACLAAACSPAVSPVGLTPTQVATVTLAPTTAPTPTTMPTLPSTATPTFSTATVIPTAGPAVIRATTVAASTPDSGAPLKLDLDTIFPPGPGRDLVLNNCTVCHTFLRIVVGQRTKDQWEYVRRDMRGRVNQLSDLDADTLFSYLEANFNDTKPVPKLPDWFLQTGEW